jgi:phenol 2-monooxygenase
MGAGPFDITGISSFKLCTLTQGRIESFYIENLRKYSGAQVERSTAPVSLEIDESVVEDVNAHPVTVILRHESVTETGSTIYTKDPARHSNTSNSFKDHKDQQALEKSKDIGHGTTKIVKAKYVIGCDGAHSWTRQQIGCQLEGDSTDYVFGVADIVPISNFRK